MAALRIILALTLAWAVIALAWQVARARAGGRVDYSRPAGSPARGLLYIFTTAMLPSHKESAKLHRIEFAAGIVMHAGALLTLIAVLAWAVRPALGGALVPLVRPVAVMALAAGLGLLIRRMSVAELRAISTPDDYLACAATCGLAGLAAGFGLGPAAAPLLPAYAAALLVYLPLGKLRHAAFFFVARGDYGRRLGYRGVLPPARAGRA